MIAHNGRTAWQRSDQPVTGPAKRGGGTWVLHHPGGDPDRFPMTDDETIASLRQTQAGYLAGRGYSIGYGYTVNQAGRSWEARGDDLNNAANAGRKVDGNFNNRSTSIQLMASDTEASPAAIAEINRIIATEPTWDVIVHGDVDYTACCGAPFIAQVRSGIIGHQDTPPVIPPASLPRIEIDGYDPPNAWWLFPIDPAKPSLDLGATGAHVQYLQDVIYFYAEGHIERTGIYDGQTIERVNDMQRLMFPTDPPTGKVDAQTWADAIDYIVTLNTSPPPPTEPPPVDVETLDALPYYVNHRDSPWSVGTEVYGNGREGARLLEADNFAMYSTPMLPVFCPCPGIAGNRTAVQPGEGAYSVMRRLGSDDPAADHETFALWNGGWERVLHAGDMVALPL